MSVFGRLVQAFGLAPLPPFHDLDTVHEPSAVVTHLPVRPVDASPRLGSPGVDGPTAPVAEAGAVGHSAEIDWTKMRELCVGVRAALETIERGLELAEVIHSHHG